jgi:TRAP transporter 4TM/12TM fusion protein
MVTPPIMGTTAFIMAMMLGVSYLEVVVAAIIPAVLFYAALFFQVDGYAGRKKLRGMQRSELPPLKQTLRKGWPFLLTFFVLIYLLFLRLESQAPFYAIGVLLFCAMIRKETRFHLKDFIEFFAQTGVVVIQLVSILAAVGVIMGAVIVTGLGHSLSRELVSLAGGNTMLMLIFGAATCYFLGMAITITPVYIFLAIVLAPALTGIGLTPIAVHLFIIYWALTSTITPPVAIVAFVAAGVGDASPFRTGFLAMRLGIILYFLPFIFVLAPSLVFQGPLIKVVFAFTTAIIGLYLLAGGLEGYLILVEMPLGWVSRLLFIITGILMSVPEWKTNILSACIATPLILYLTVKRRSVVGSQALKHNGQS